MGILIGIIFILSLFPNYFHGINIGIAYISPIRVCLILLPLFYLFKQKNTASNNRFVIIFSKNNLSVIGFMVLWLLYSIFTLVWVRNISAWSHAQYFLGMAVLCVIMFDAASLSTKEFVLILKMSTIMYFIHNVIGWSELLTHQYMFASLEKVEYMTARNQFFPISIFGNLNDFAFMMMTGVFLTYIIYRITSHKILKLFYLILMMSSSILIFLSQSRGCIIGLGLGIICIFCLEPRRKKVKAASIGIGMFLITLVLFFDKYVSVFRKVLKMMAFTIDGSQMNSEAVRINLLKNGVDFMINTFGFGVGSGNAETWMSTDSIYNTKNIINVHNWWGEIAINYGVIIFILYLITYAGVGLVLYKLWKKSKEKTVKIVAAGFLSCVISFIIGAISSSSLWGTEWIWVLWAVIIAFLRQKDKLKEDKKYESVKEIY
jgi:teichuronic acid biosynthesis protein TuaE